MTFLALLTKELRLRMRRERTIWVIIAYILLMGLMGWFFISSFINGYGYKTYNLSSVGTHCLFCSTIFKRPSVSTAVAYMCGLLWLTMPLVIYFILLVSNSLRFGPGQPLLFIWNPIVALISTYSPGTTGLITIGQSFH